MFKVNNKDTRTIEGSIFGLFIVNLEHNFNPFSSVSVFDFEQVNVC